MEQELQIGSHQLCARLALPEQGSSVRAGCLIVHGLTRGYSQFDSVAGMLLESGVASLRFDCRGRGGTEGEFTLKSMTEDIKDAWTHLKQSCPQVPLITLARGEGAYCTIMALWREEVAAKIFWAPIFYPRTSRELQGHIHEFRQNGFAILKLPDGESYYMGKQFFIDLDTADDAYHFVMADDKILIISPERDQIVPLPYVHEFLEKVRPKLAASPELQVLDATHPHTDLKYPNNYAPTTIEFILRLLGDAGP